MYRFHGSVPVFIDTRVDLYDKEFCLQFIQVVQHGTDWKPVFSKYKISSALIPNDSAIDFCPWARSGLAACLQRFEFFVVCAKASHFWLVGPRLEKSWQQSFWGSNYARLRSVKRNTIQTHYSLCIREQAAKHGALTDSAGVHKPSNSGIASQITFDCEPDLRGDNIGLQMVKHFPA